MWLPSAWSKDDDDDDDDDDTCRIALGLLLTCWGQTLQTLCTVCYCCSLSLCSTGNVSGLDYPFLLRGGMRPHEGTAVMTASQLRVSKCGWSRPRRDVGRFGVDCQKLLWRFADERANWWRVAVYRWDTWRSAVWWQIPGLLAGVHCPFRLRAVRHPSAPGGRAASIAGRSLLKRAVQYTTLSDSRPDGRALVGVDYVYYARQMPPLRPHSGYGVETIWCVGPCCSINDQIGEIVAVPRSSDVGNPEMLAWWQRLCVGCISRWWWWWCMQCSA